MRRYLGIVLTVGLLLAPASIVRAQDALNAYGSYPSGITTGSPAPYGLYSSGTYGRSVGYPFSYQTQLSPYYGTNYVTPGTNYVMPGTNVYSSGYRGYSYPGTTYSYAVPGSSGYTYSYPAYSTSPGYGTSYVVPNNFSYYGYSPYSYNAVGRRFRRW